MDSQTPLANELRVEAARLTQLAADYRANGFAFLHGIPWGRVQPGQVAVEQMKQALASWPACLRHPLRTEPRPVRQRWLLDPQLHMEIHALADAYAMSLSDLVMYMIQPTGRPQVDAVRVGLRFRPPPWVSAAARAKAREHRRTRGTERFASGRPSSAPRVPWPWRAAGMNAAEAKSAFKRWLLAHHPDQGGDHEFFVRGKDDFEAM